MSTGQDDLINVDDKILKWHLISDVLRYHYLERVNIFIVLFFLSIDNIFNFLWIYFVSIMSNFGKKRQVRLFPGEFVTFVPNISQCKEKLGETVR